MWWEKYHNPKDEIKKKYVSYIFYCIAYHLYDVRYQKIQRI